MKNLLFFGTILFSLCSFTTFEHAPIIYEGKGVGELNLSMTFDEVDEIIKSKYQKIKWAEYSYEYKYKKQGLSFWTKQDDPTGKVFTISINPKKWNGKTSKGLLVSKNLLVKDVIAVYGRPEWSYTEDCTELEVEIDDIRLGMLH